MSYKNAKVFLAAAVALNGTISVPYPTNTDSGHFVGTYAHKAWASGLQKLLAAPTDFTVSFGTTDITVTYKGSTSLPANSYVNFQFDALGDDKRRLRTDVDNTHNLLPITPYVINLGAPDVADADGFCASQDLTALGVFSIGVTAAATIAAAALVGRADKPRNVVAAWTGTGVLTVTGTDEYGRVIRESSASGTSLTGKKAFKTVTGISSSANITALTVGTGDVLGLPVALPQVGLNVREMQDGAVATAGTLVAAVRTTATATTGDVRGTYDPNAACDGAKAFTLIAMLPDPTDLGITQF